MSPDDLRRYQQAFAAAAVDPTAPPPPGVDPEAMQAYAELVVRKRIAQARRGYPRLAREPGLPTLVRRWWAAVGPDHADEAARMRSFGAWVRRHGPAPLGDLLRDDHLGWRLTAPGPWLVLVRRGWRLALWVRWTREGAPARWG